MTYISLSQVFVDDGNRPSSSKGQRSFEKELQIRAIRNTQRISHEMIPVGSHMPKNLSFFHHYMPSFDNYIQTPKALHRRRSDYTSGSFSLVKLNRTHSLRQTVSNVQPRFPSEILDRIVQLAIGSCRLFSSIASFTLASSHFRQITLRRFFRTLSVRSSAHWSSLCAFLDEVNMYGPHSVETGYLWVR